MSKESDTVLPVRSERMDQAKVTELHFMDLSHDIKRSILSYVCIEILRTTTLSFVPEGKPMAIDNPSGGSQSVMLDEQDPSRAGHSSTLPENDALHWRPKGCPYQLHAKPRQPRYTTYPENLSSIGEDALLGTR